MKLHILEQEQRLEVPLSEIFPFFSRPENLELLTPDSVGFNVLTPSPIPMHAGAIIDYIVRVNGIPMRWTTCISEFDPPYRFVDVQLRGPYSFWHHTHTFEDLGNSTLIRDVVNYGLPGGPFGELAHSLFIRRQLNGIFSFRRNYLDTIEDWTRFHNDTENKSS